jgi:hypothetical protein
MSLGKGEKKARKKPDWREKDARSTRSLPAFFDFESDSPESQVLRE